MAKVGSAVATEHKALELSACTGNEGGSAAKELASIRPQPRQTTLSVSPTLS